MQRQLDHCQKNSRWLPDLVLPSRVNQTWTFSGMDSPDRCLDKHKFQTYPYEIEYRYNSRGFRDEEWPADLSSLQEAIWCVGDSFTVGLGQPYSHIWPYLLQHKTGKRTINVSMDGASNDWIARKIQDICHALDPSFVVVMWSFFHRRESPQSYLPDEQRRLHADQVSNTRVDFANFRFNVESVQSLTNSCHLLIPHAYYSRNEYNNLWNRIKKSHWPSVAPDDLCQLPHSIVSECKQHEIWDQLQQFDPILDKIINRYLYKAKVRQVEKQDLARDGFHFDIKTASALVDLVIKDLDL